MQNKYVAGVGDFGKHGLLRRLSGATSDDDLGPLRLGLVWYAYPGVCDNLDGKFVQYLDPTKKNLDTFGACDSEPLDETAWTGGRERPLYPLCGAGRASCPKAPPTTARH